MAPELEVTNNPKPEPMQTELTNFLTQNNCAAVEDKDACYVRTRLVMIKMARRIDYLADRLYVSKGTINNLVTNLNGVITELGSVKQTINVK